jgi:hypothetical protein
MSTVGSQNRHQRHIRIGSQAANSLTFRSDDPPLPQDPRAAQAAIGLGSSSSSYLLPNAVASRGMLTGASSFLSPRMRLTPSTA